MLDGSITARLGKHRDGEIFTSLPRSGQVSAAQVLAEWGDCREACDTPTDVAALAGQCPVTKRSGNAIPHVGCPDIALPFSC